MYFLIRPTSLVSLTINGYCSRIPYVSLWHIVDVINFSNPIYKD